VFIPQLFGPLARKVESDSLVGIPGAPGRLVADMKTELDIVHVASFFGLDIYVFSDIFLWWLNTSELDFYIFFWCVTANFLSLKF
jgi:hypothetical protein